jgi:hypothetical protein
MRPDLKTWVADRSYEKIGLRPHLNLVPDLVFMDGVMRQAGITGHVAEIGVAGGRLFIPLMLCTREHELAVAIDVFGDRAANYNPAGGTSQREQLHELVRGVYGHLDFLRVVEGDSIRLSAMDVLRTTQGEAFRFFSIDGAHSAHHTVNDLHIAGECLTAGGVVLVDDIQNWGWPGVIEGVSRYFLLNDYTKLAPFCLWRNKLLMTTHSHQTFWLERSVTIANHAGRTRHNVDYRRSNFFGWQVLGW